MEALVNFQQMIIDLTGLDIANASLLDEGTAAAEAVAMAHAISKSATSNAVFVSQLCHPQTIAIVRPRAKGVGLNVIVGDESTLNFDQTPVFALLVQYPDTTGVIHDFEGLFKRA